MSDELQAQLAAFLSAMLDAAKLGGEWATGQIPLLVQDKILYGRVMESLTVAMGAGLLLGGALCVRSLVKHGAFEGDDPFSACAFLSLVGAIIGSGMGTFVFFDNVPDAVQVWLAPRLYIIEWLSGLAK